MYNSVIATCLVLDVRGTAICLAIDFAAINLKETLARILEPNSVREEMK